MTRPGVPLLALLLLGLASAPAYAQPASALEAPAYTEGDFWEYRVDVHLDEILGTLNLTGSLGAEGLTTARVTSSVEGRTRITWNGKLSLGGSVAFATNGNSPEIPVSGKLDTTYTELMEAPYLLPTAFQNLAEFDLADSFPVPVTANASLGVEGTMSPNTEWPTYPVAEGEQEFTNSAAIVSTLNASFLGEEIRNVSSNEVISTLRLNLTPAGEIVVAGRTFSALRVTTEAITGFVPGPFQAFLPASTQIAYHAVEVGNAVLFQFLVNETEVGNATLSSFSYGAVGEPPFWQQPIFLVSLLVIPIAILLFRYWRERRRGL